MTQKEVIMQLEGLCVEPEPNKEPRLDADELDAVLIAIEALKARPHGKWITIHKQNSFGQDCICFECDKCHKYKVPIYKLMITEPLEVCPNCGAQMEKEGEE